MKKKFTLTLFLFVLVIYAYSQGPVVIDTVTGNEKLLTEFTDKLYFARNDSIFTVTPGNDEVELLVKLGDPVVNPGLPEEHTSALGRFLADFPTTSNHIFFVTEDASGGYELWISDGTAAGTQSVFESDYLDGFTVFNGLRYFIGGEDETLSVAEALYRVEANGDLTNITSGSQAVSLPLDANLAATADTLFFTANHSTLGTEIFKLGANESSPTLLADHSPGGAKFNNQ